jgi:3-oxoacyl-[acyl-carrier-protein] synthase II
MMPAYICSTEAISPQPTFSTGRLLAETVRPEGPYFTCLNPDYRLYIDPGSLRRMSKVIRMALTASRVCLENAGIDRPDAIIIGSGLGCVQDTARFLNQIIDHNEQLLNPTAFIQSTHNTVSGQIALMLACKAYNLTFSQKTISFESALLDAMMLLKEDGVSNLLVGGVDEIIEESFRLMVQSGCAKGTMEEEILNSTTGGAVAGEGATFFVLSDVCAEGSLAQIDDLEIICRCRGFDPLKTRLESFLSRNGLSVKDIDLLVTGKNGDARFSGIYDRVSQLFAGSIVAGFKHLVGEYDTSSAFGTFLATKIIHENRVPGVVRMNGVSRGHLSRVLVFNYSRDQDFTFTLLSEPQI